MRANYDECTIVEGQPRLLSRMVRAWWMAARATALAVSLRAWTLYHRCSRGLRRISLSGCGLKNSLGLMFRSRYTVAATPVVELAAATISQGLLSPCFQPATRAAMAAGAVTGA